MKKFIGICFLTLSAISHAATSHEESNFGFIDILQWQVRESGADNWAEIFHITPEKTTVKLVDAPFDWNTGIRIGIGHTFNQNSNDTTIAYTHYQVTASNQAAGTVASAFDGAYFANNTNGAKLGLAYNNASVRWQFFYNTVDLNRGHHFDIDPVLQIHPYLGLKAASINQTIYTNWYSPSIPTTFTNATENLKNDFSGVGPTIGADTTWAIYTGPAQSLSLVGNIGGGILYGHWRFREVYKNNTPVTITIYVGSVNGAAPVATGLLGMQWKKQFKQADFSVRAGYEAQMWFNQVQFYSLSMGRANRPVSIQGGNLEFRLNI